MTFPKGTSAGPGQPTSARAVMITGYLASPGWDPVTGWGSPDAKVLIPLLARYASPLADLADAACVGHKRARGGSSAVLVVRGEPGIGKTALLDYAAGRAVGFRVIRAWGVESEMELAFAGLHQLCVPMLGRLDQLPGPQRDALAVAFGMREGPAPDRFLVGLAALSLLAATAEDQPLACLVDDAQWLDRATVQCLAFAARRLLADPVAMILAARQPDDHDELASLAGLTLTGLGDADARTLLASAVGGRLDAEVRDRIVAETGGNPLALLQLPRGLGPAELAGGFWLPDPRPLASRIETSASAPERAPCCGSFRPLTA